MGLPGSKKKRSRLTADLATVFGVVPSRLSYADYVGLAMNLQRGHLRWAFAAAQGAAFAATDDDLPAALFDGVAETEDQAAEMAFAANCERRFQREWAKIRRGGK